MSSTETFLARPALLTRSSRNVGRGRDDRPGVGPFALDVAAHSRPTETICAGDGTDRHRVDVGGGVDAACWTRARRVCDWGAPARRGSPQHRDARGRSPEASPWGAARRGAPRGRSARTGRSRRRVRVPSRGAPGIRARRRRRRRSRRRIYPRWPTSSRRRRRRRSPSRESRRARALLGGLVGRSRPHQDARRGRVHRLRGQRGGRRGQPRGVGEEEAVIFAVFLSLGGGLGRDIARRDRVGRVAHRARGFDVGRSTRLSHRASRNAERVRRIARVDTGDTAIGQRLLYSRDLRQKRNSARRFWPSVTRGFESIRASRFGKRILKVCDSCPASSSHDGRLDWPGSPGGACVFSHRQTNTSRPSPREHTRARPRVIDDADRTEEEEEKAADDGGRQ